MDSIIKTEDHFKILAENHALKDALGSLQAYVEDTQKVIVAENDALRAELGRLQEFVHLEQRSITDENAALRLELGRLQDEYQQYLSRNELLHSKYQSGAFDEQSLLEIGRAAMSGAAIQRVPQVCFFHISKTAGTSVHNFLSSTVRGELFQGDFDAVSRAELQKYSLVSGHMSYQHIRKLRKPHALITFLRNPVDRVISTYYYLRHSPVSSKHSELAHCMSFREFLKCEDPDVVTFMRDHQTYALASDYRTHRTYDKDIVLKAAWTHLQEFTFVGFVEHSELSIKRLSRLLGVPYQRPPRLNASPRPAVSELNDEDLLLARELNELDCRLYDLAIDRYLPSLLSRKHYAESLLKYRKGLQACRRARR